MVCIFYKISHFQIGLFLYNQQRQIGVCIFCITRFGVHKPSSDVFTQCYTSGICEYVRISPITMLMLILPLFIIGYCYLAYLFALVYEL
jgi:hypothetical protein